jgi:ankyrin repeat protein
VVEACWIEDEAAARRFRADVPEVAGTLSAEERKLLAHAARNNRTVAVRLLLESGLPVGVGGQHRGTPLHWAAYHGNADMIRAILKFNPDLDDTGNDFNGTPIEWAVHGSEHGWYARSGDYPQAIELLLQAGAKRPETIGGTPAVRAVLERP